MHKPSIEFSRCNSFSEDFDSKFYPRTPPPPIQMLNNNDSKKEDKFVSASPMKISNSKGGVEFGGLEKALHKTISKTI